MLSKHLNNERESRKKKRNGDEYQNAFLTWKLKANFHFVDLVNLMRAYTDLGLSSTCNVHVLLVFDIREVPPDVIFGLYELTLQL